MSSPIKPWEGLSNSAMVSEFLETDKLMSGSSDISVNGVPAGVPSFQGGPLNTLNPTPPPLPARRPQMMSNYDQTGYYSQMYPRYSGISSVMGGYSPYQAYRGYPRRMWPSAYADDYDSGMMQAAEESSQALFGPLDSFVRAVSSMAMVLDSTLQSMQFSFRTVVSAADSLSRLKSVITDLAASMSIIRLTRLFFLRICRMLGLMKGSNIEKEWVSAFAKTVKEGQAAAGQQPGQSPWPAIAFFALMMGGPYLMFKMFPPAKQPAATSWKPNAQNSVSVIAIYDFKAVHPSEMSMKKGDQLLMMNSLPKQGWAMVSNGQQSGLVPFNRLNRLKVKKVLIPPEVSGIPQTEVPTSCEVPSQNQS